MEDRQDYCNGCKWLEDRSDGKFVDSYRCGLYGDGLEYTHNVDTTIREQCIREIERKQTAKEILTYVGNLYDDCDQRFRLKDYQWHKDLCKKYGVRLDDTL